MENFVEDCGDTFASRLKFLRKEKQISIQKLAKDLKLKTELIEDWEAGLKIADLLKAIKLAKYFNVNLGFLVGIEDRHYVSTKNIGSFKFK